MARDSSIGELLVAARAGATVLTATERLARWLTDRYSEERLAAGARVWERPAILSWSAWLRRVWAERTAHLGDRCPALLQPFQEHALWELIVAADPRAERLLGVAGAARGAQQAWELVQAYEIDLEHIGPHLSDDCLAFRDWAAEFRRRLDRLGFATAAELPRMLASPVPAGTPAWPERVLLAGFDRVTPAQQRLAAVLVAAGGGVDIAAVPQRASAPVRHRFRDRREELMGAACWARARLLARPDARIGIVVPDLSQRRAEVARVLEDILAPAAVLAGEDCGLVNLSAGGTLADEPVVHDALQVFSLCQPPVPLERLSVLLRSPFLGGGDSEALARARLDAGLRALGEPELELTTVLKQCGESASRRYGSACPGFHEHLRNVLVRAESMPRRATPARWAEILADLLDAVDWPGDRVLDSREYQAVGRLRELLGALRGLTPVWGEVSYGKALSALRRLASEATFQPGAEGEAPVQVLGVLETAGLAFDHLWVLGLDDEAWPAPPSPTPFLPIELQRRLRVPRASPAEELEFARAVTARLLTAADEVVVSHAEWDDDRALRVSPLIADLPLTDGGIELVPPYVREIWRARVLDALDDAHGPAIPPGERVDGGAGVLGAQAACPFQAFARHRLGARPLESPRYGLDSRERGNLAHRVLQEVWRELGDSETLRALSEAQQQSLLGAVADRVLTEVALERPLTVGPRFLRIERARLIALASEWLALERERPAFSVRQIERDHEISFRGMRFRTRLDRVDRLPDGRELIIDYKTGKNQLGAWRGERPDDPQLPLYAITHSAPVAGVYFGWLRSGECRFVGVGEEAELVPGCRDWSALKPDESVRDWPGVLAEWERVLSGLADAHQAGEARTDPKNGAQTCATCRMQMLCRVHAPAAEEEAGGDE